MVYARDQVERFRNYIRVLNHNFTAQYVRLFHQGANLLLSKENASKFVTSLCDNVINNILIVSYTKLTLNLI